MARTRASAAGQAARKPAARKAAMQKVGAKKPAVKKAATKKVAARKPKVKKAVARKPVVKSSAAGRRTPAGLGAKRPAKPGALARTSGQALRLAGVGTDAVAKATGKAWDQWLAILDQAGATAMPHKAIARMLAEKFGVPPWWSQMLTVGYEQSRGLREAYQKADGFSASASRTMQAGLERLHGAWADPKLRALWLGDAPVTVRRHTDGKSMRITWGRGSSRVDVNFHAAGAGKSRVQVEHGKLGDSADAREKKAFWGAALDRLKAMLEKAA